MGDGGSAKGAYRKHLLGLIEDEHLHGVGAQEAALDHVVDTARSSNDDLGAVLEGLHVIANAGSTNAGVALDVHEVANSDNDLLDLLSQFTGGGEDQSLALLHSGVDLLENGNGESSRLASTRLGLGNHVVTLNDGHDGTLLDGRRALETVGVNYVSKASVSRVFGCPHGAKLTTTEELRLQGHVIERVNGLVIVRLDLSC